ncbi:MAG: hypothetical protein IPI23_19300 [Bacteroidetes bacterium]|nr:hypothetical protein [Bacteroidota bacterium]
MENNDFNEVFKDSGLAIFAYDKGKGVKRISEAIENLMKSPFLNNVIMKKAKYFIINITYGAKAVSMDEIGEITDFIHDKIDINPEIIIGIGVNLELKDDIVVTLIATGYDGTLRKSI